MKSIEQWFEAHRAAIGSIVCTIGWVSGLFVELATISFFSTIAMLMLLLYNAEADTTLYQFATAMHGDIFWEGVLALSILCMGAIRAVGGRGPRFARADDYHGFASAECVVSKAPISQ